MNNLLTIRLRNNKVLAGITIFLVLLTAVVSVFLSLMIAQNQAISKETKRLSEVTNGVLMRMNSTRTQLTHVVDYFASVPEKEACAPRHIRKMQEFNIAGFFLQAVAHVKDNRMVCSSMSEVFDGVALGEPFRIEPDGTRMWADIEVTDWQNHHLVVIEKAGWAIVLVPSHAIEGLGNSAVSMGIFGIQSQKIYSSKGQISAEWLHGYQGKQTLTFIDKKRHMLVHIAPNKLNLTGVVAAMPLEDINDDLISFIQILIPLAIVVGISVSGIYVYMRKTRYSTRSAILRALANNEFFLEYQPIINLENQHCVGAEALIRWKTPDNHFVSPDIFIPAAEASGVICQITQRVFALVAKDMHAALNTHKNFHVGINISSQDFRSGALLPMIEQLKKSTGAKGNQILIEVTERGFLDDEAALATIKNIRECGVMVAIDDFGTGYSSLSYLTKFQLDYLKIDKTFVDSVGTDAVTSQVAFHIIEMAKTLQLGMVAEGVETVQQAEILQARGVKYVQGWLFSKSLKKKDFYAYLDQHR